MKRNFIIIIAVFMLIGAALYKNVNKADLKVSVMDQEAPKKNNKVPSFLLTGLDEKTYKVGGTREKLLLINFWASWCGPCKVEAPDLVEIYHANRNRLDVFAVNATKYDRAEEAKIFVQTYKLNFPVLLDPKGTVTDKYGVFGFPTSFLVDKNGVIREVIYGVIKPDKLVQIIDSIYKE